MKYLAAYLLLAQGGNTSPSVEDIKSVIESVGAEVEESRISTLLTSLEGKTIEEVIAEGSAKLASVPASGAVAPVAGGASGATGTGEAAEEKEEEAAEESDDDMGLGLFD